MRLFSGRWKEIVFLVLGVAAICEFISIISNGQRFPKALTLFLTYMGALLWRYVVQQWGNKGCEWYLRLMLAMFYMISVVLGLSILAVPLSDQPNVPLINVSLLLIAVTLSMIVACIILLIRRKLKGTPIAIRPNGT
jgi:hypothetical protein